MNDTSGLDKARETMAAIKGEKTQKEEQSSNALISTKAELAANKDLANYFQAEANNIDDGDMDGMSSLPFLRLHTEDSTSNELSDGQDPTPGNYFHSVTQKQYENPIAHILYVKQCKLEQEDKKTGEKYMKSHYLVGGILDEGDVPFVLFIKGMSYNKMWDLQDEMKPFRKNRKMPIPMFAMKVQLSSVMEKPQDPTYAKKRVIILKLVKRGDFPMIESSIARLDFFKDKALFFKDELTVYAQERGEDGHEINDLTPEDEAPQVEEQVVPAEDVADDIPF